MPVISEDCFSLFTKTRGIQAHSQGDSGMFCVKCHTLQHSNRDHDVAFMAFKERQELERGKGGKGRKTLVEGGTWVITLQYNTILQNHNAQNFGFFCDFKLGIFKNN